MSEPLTDAELDALLVRVPQEEWRFRVSGTPEHRNLTYYVESGTLLVCDAAGANTDRAAIVVLIAALPRLTAELRTLRAALAEARLAADQMRRELDQRE